jgi:hypothetical protein
MPLFVRTSLAHYYVPLSATRHLHTSDLSNIRIHAMPATTTSVAPDDGASQSEDDGACERTFSVRNILAGLVTGSLICFASLYYGLQSDKFYAVAIGSIGLFDVSTVCQTVVDAFHPK